MPRVVRINPDRVIIPVMIGLAHRVQRLAPIERLAQLNAHHKNPVHILRIAHHSRVIHRALIKLVPPLPGCALIVRSKNPTLPIRRLNRRVNHIRIHRRNHQPNPPHIHRWQSRLQLVPGRSRVGRLINRALRPAINQSKNMPPPLIRRRINNVRIRRIELHIHHARVLTDRQHGLPVFSAVRRLIESAISTRTPQRPLCRHINNLRIPRVYYYSSNVLRLLQPQILPTLSPVHRLVNSVAISHAAL